MRGEAAAVQVLGLSPSARQPTSAAEPRDAIQTVSQSGLHRASVWDCIARLRRAAPPCSSIGVPRFQVDTWTRHKKVDERRAMQSPRASQWTSAASHVNINLGYDRHRSCTQWSYGVVVSTLDVESSDQGSNPCRTLALFLGTDILFPPRAVPVGKKGVFFEPWLLGREHGLALGEEEEEEFIGSLEVFFLVKSSRALWSIKPDFPQ